MQLQISTDGKINGRLSSIFQITLDGSNGSLAFINFTKGDTFTLIVKQDSTGSRTVTWPSGLTWQAKQAPSLQTAASSQDVFTFTCTGTGTFTDGAGSPNRLPPRLIAVGLATMAVIGTASGMVGARFNLSGGNGQGVGALPAAIEVRSKSGSELLTAVDGSGSALIGSGILAVGSVNTRGTDAPFRVLNNGTTNVRSTVSGYTINVSGLGAATSIPTTGAVPCIKAGGLLGWMARTATGTLIGTCN